MNCYEHTFITRQDLSDSQAKKLVSKYEDIIEKNSIKNILELGCGQGRDSVFFAKLGYYIVAVDISENAIKFVEKIKKDIHQKQSSVKILALKENNIISENDSKKYMKFISKR